MGSAKAWLQVVRIPAIVVLFVVAGRFSETMVEGITRLQVGTVWRGWVPLALLGAAAATLIVTGRDPAHHPAILAGEALISALLGFVPAVQWVMWFGVTGFVGSTFAHGADGFTQSLAIVWFVTVVATAVRQRAGEGTRRSDPPGA